MAFHIRTGDSTLDTSVLATIIGGLAAVLGVGMAVIAILASRSMKAAQADHDQAHEADDQAASATELPKDASDDDPNAFVDPFATGESTDNATAFTDPFASDKSGDQDDSLEWGSAFDDPEANPDDQWGFEADDGAKADEPDPKKPRPDSNEGT